MEISHNTQERSHCAVITAASASLNMKITRPWSGKEWIKHSIFQFILIMIAASYVQMQPSYEGTIRELWQYLPVDILAKYGFSSIYYIHQQPPLLNTIVIIATKFSSVIALESFVSGVMVIILFLNILLVNKIISLCAIRQFYSWVYIIFPSFALYHFWFYEPAFTLLFTNLIILSLIDKPSRSVFGMFVAGLTGLALAHGVFHPVIALIFICSGWILVFRKIDLGKFKYWIVALSLLPVLLMAKNFELVGSPSLSSWAGCNLHQKLMTIGTGFDYVPKSLDGLPEILGASKYGIANKINVNNVDFAAHCNENLRMIAEKITEREVFLAYLAAVAETIRNNESVLSIEYRGAGFSPGNWGKAAPFIVWISSLKSAYSPVLLAVSLVGPMLALLLSIRTRLFRSLFILVVIYYFGLLSGHLFNGWEQMRMAYRSSFFLFLCTLFCIQRLLSIFNLFPISRDFLQMNKMNDTTGQPSFRSVRHQS